MNIVLKKPMKKDAKYIYELVKDTKILDLNSEYLYLLQATHFRDTCVIAEDKGDICGFVSGYIIPTEPHIFFIWQVGVDAKYKGHGIAGKMIMDILGRKELSHITQIHTTISPSNIASTRVFEKFADKYGIDFERETMFKVADFSNSHEDEVLYKIRLK